MVKIWATGFELNSQDDDALTGETVALCVHPDCVKTATEWINRNGYCVQHKPTKAENPELLK